MAVPSLVRVTRPRVTWRAPLAEVETQREKRFRAYLEAPGFRLGPHAMTRAQTRGDRVVLSIVDFPVATFCPRQPLVRAQQALRRGTPDAAAAAVAGRGAGPARGARRAPARPLQLSEPPRVPGRVSVTDRAPSPAGCFIIGCRSPERPPAYLGREPRAALYSPPPEYSRILHLHDCATALSVAAAQGGPVRAPPWLTA